MPFLHIHFSTDRFMQNSKTTVRLDVNEANIKSVRVRDLIGQIKSNYDHEPKYKFELMFGGLCMRPDQSLGYYGVQSGATIFLMDRSQHWIEEEDRKEEDEDEEEDLPTQSQNKRQKLNTPEMDLVMTAIQLVMMDADFRAMLRRLCDTDTREQLLAKVPALAKDLVALSMLQDTNLLTSLQDKTSLNKVLQQHPALVDAAGALVSMFEQLNGPRPLPQMSVNQASNRLDRQENQYSMMNLSDDDEELDPNAPSQGQRVLMPNLLNNNNIRRINAGQTSSTAPSTSSSGSLSRAIAANPRGNAEITLDMLRQALGIGTNDPVTGESSLQTANIVPQTAASTSSLSASTRQSTSAGVIPSSSSGEAPTINSNPILPTSASTSNASSNWTQQLIQMHQLGLNDDGVNVQALEASNGDLSAAIELIFSGVFN